MTIQTRRRRCQKCGGYGIQDHPTGFCSGLFDPYHTTGRPDIHPTTPAEQALTAEEYVRKHHA
jgi:hypothetical protein